MQKLVIGMRNSRGFTLIEIMVVIVIIGITIGFALIAFGDFGHSKRVLFAIEHLSSQLKLAQQQALLENTTLGLEIDTKSYQIVELKNGTWHSFKTGPFKTHYFPDHTFIFFKKIIHSKSQQPKIFINSQGELSPFNLIFGSAPNQFIANLASTRDGNFKLNKISKND